MWACPGACVCLVLRSLMVSRFPAGVRMRASSWSVVFSMRPGSWGITSDHAVSSSVGVRTHLAASHLHADAEGVSRRSRDGQLLWAVWTQGPVEMQPHRHGLERDADAACPYPAPHAETAIHGLKCTPPPPSCSPWGFMVTSHLTWAGEAVQAGGQCRVGVGAAWQLSREESPAPKDRGCPGSWVSAVSHTLAWAAKQIVCCLRVRLPCCMWLSC